MRKLFRLLRYVAFAVVLLILVAAAAFYFMGSAGRSALENYLAQQLVAIANHYLGPQISFKSIDYQYPRTVVLNDVRLTADDPTASSGHVDILAAKSLTLELAEIPRVGQPFRIQQLKLDHPELRLIAAAPASPKFLGFSQFLKNTSAPAPESAPAATPAAKQDLRLSSVFEINLIEITGGLVVLDPRIKDQPAMQLDQINTRLNIKPAAGEKGEPGWYALDINLARDPVFSLQALGKLNLDTALINLDKLHLAITLGREQDHFLPPAFQQFLRAHEVTGQFALDAHGTFPLSDPNAASLAAQLNLTKAQFAVGERRWPVDSLRFDASLTSGQAKLDSLQASLLGGQVSANGSLQLTGDHLASATLQLSHIQVQQTLRHATNSPSDLKGDLSGQISWRAPVAKALVDSRGSGNLTITNATLAPIPVLGKLVDSLQGVIKIVGLGGDTPKDSATVEFSFQGDKLNFSHLDLETTVANLRGTGDIFFDKRLDLTFTGGPLDKAQPLLKNLGDIGKTLGKATDQISAYTVTGTTDAPKVSVKLAPGLTPNLKLPKF